ncbi:nitrogenase [Cereibacter azotoformans]|uniref:Nitrogenase molybdenum-iron protein beta chain n=1 Tax=Cereibacter azotoformans TaxID=43057 RepID=A0A2T5JT72_9RHOB|nr:nitrogenase component 1 [Cereibacter azotoformans]AXQ95731.1 nitrogenase [Cereibacter sphaeroides]PTR12973.1 nitrogenase molybdenum-iron protein beta chain [Cereibacter azotoformans]UIJ32769.1 nitrogenase [Cereibacter azotoformans]
MARPLVGPPASCALHGAILTAAAIPGVIPLVHSTPGCALRAGTGVTGDLSGAPPGLPLVASTNLAEKHVVFGGTSRLREEIKNTLAVVESGLVAVLTGCPTEMIGDDVAAMVKEVTSQGEAVIDIQTAGFRGPARAGYDLLLTALASRLEPRAEPADVPRINILGIVPGIDPHWLSELEELSRLLAGVGLRANPVFGPAGGLDALHALGRAEASLVLSPWGVGPAEALRQRLGIPTVVAEGLPVGAAAVEALLRRLSEALGRPLDGAAEAFLASERRHEDYLLNQILGRLVSAGRQRVAVIGGSLAAPGLERFLTTVLGWKTVALVLTDEPPAALRPALAAEGAIFAPDAASRAEAILTSGASLLIGGADDRALAGRRGIAFVDAGSVSGLGALTGGHAGRAGAARLLSALVTGLEAADAPALRPYPAEEEKVLSLGLPGLAVDRQVQILA